MTPGPTLTATHRRYALARHRRVEHELAECTRRLDETDHPAAQDAIRARVAEVERMRAADSPEQETR